LQRPAGPADRHEWPAALAFTALNLPFGLGILLAMALLAPLPVHWRLPGITLLLAGCALMTLQLGGEWLNPLAIWSLYALLGLEIIWQARPKLHWRLTDAAN